MVYIKLKDRIYLDVSYTEKDNVKRLGCKWDSDLRCFYCVSSMFESVKLYNKNAYKIVNGQKIFINN